MPSSTSTPPDYYVVSGFNLTMRLNQADSQVYSDIISVSSTYVLNGIPTMVITLAAGVRADNPAKIASSHKIFGKGSRLRPRSPVEVFLEIKTSSGNTAKSPSQKLCIFRGYYVGFGYQRHGDSVYYQLNVMHWLDNLNIGSMMSRNWMPGAPYSLQENAASWAPSLEEGNNGVTSVVPTIDNKREIVNAANVGSDLWGKALRPVLLSIADWPAPDNCSDEDKKADDEGRRLLKSSLNSIQSAAGGLKLDEAKLDPTFATEALRSSSLRLVGNNWKYSTFWNKLVGEWAPLFQFAISPGAVYAQFVPYFGALRFDPTNSEFKVIGADEYNKANLFSNTTTLIEGVDILWPYEINGSGLVTLPNNEKNRVIDFCQSLASFPDDAARDHRGTVIVKNPPAWILNYCTSINSPVQTITAPSPGSPGGGSTPGTSPDQLKTAAKFWAEQWYKTEFLQQRVGELSGKLRFDIAPGSTVKIKAPAHSAHLPDNIDMVASVIQVSFAINAETSTAGTAFSLANIRTIDEDQSDNITSAKPPLYTKKWGGGPLATTVGSIPKPT